MKIPNISILAAAKLAWSLGLTNIFRVLKYRVLIHYEKHPSQKISNFFDEGAFFVQPETKLLTESMTDNWTDYFLSFGWKHVALAEGPPDFLEASFGGGVIAADRPWWKIPETSDVVSEIKLVWEKSRFSWAPIFASRSARGGEKALLRLNAWIAHWCKQNPPYLGPNWKCGQEASIRIMSLALSAIILGQMKEPTNALLKFLSVHVDRIIPTVDYAIGQDNNHGTSEAAALFIAGAWRFASTLDPEEKRSAEKTMLFGRDTLEERISYLVESDGGFCMYSTNYHRVLLDTLSLVELCRRILGLPAFSKEFKLRAKGATEWLLALTDFQSGGVPNIGANDSSLLLGLTDAPITDFRPSLRVASALFMDRNAFSDLKMSTDILETLGIEEPKEMVEWPQSKLFSQSGFAVLRGATAFAVLKFPRSRKRPSQADALHLDLWYNGQNILRDGGTFSYASTSREIDHFDFAATARHNTIEFDNRDQMKRIGQFLYLDWLNANFVGRLEHTQSVQNFASGYSDSFGAFHSRSIQFSERSLRVQDRIGGFNDKAILRWRVAPLGWKLKGHVLTSDQMSISISSDSPIASFKVCDDFESQHYLEKTKLNVLEIVLMAAGTVTTEFNWSAQC